jgi:hypothetical protein
MLSVFAMLPGRPWGTIMYASPVACLQEGPRLRNAITMYEPVSRVIIKPTISTPTTLRLSMAPGMFRRGKPTKSTMKKRDM